MYKKIDGDWKEIEEKKTAAGSSDNQLKQELQAARQENEYLWNLAYMSDADLMALAKEKGIDGKIKDRKTIIDKINE